MNIRVRLVAGHLSLVMQKTAEGNPRSRSEAVIEPALNRWVTFGEPQPLAVP